MKQSFFAKAIGTISIAVTTAGLGMLVNAQRVHADDTMSKAEVGLRIAPVPLNLAGKDQTLVGLGSFIVNSVADCNGCHTASPQTEYLPTGNPYFLGHPTKAVNPATYLGGGQDFGMISAPPSPDIVTRNLTPDKHGLPAGLTYGQFNTEITTGRDLSHVHPNCSSTVTTNCFPLGAGLPPFNGNLLQIMPWPAFQNMSDQELQAIYTYLSTIPCLEGGPCQPPERCQ